MAKQCKHPECIMSIYSHGYCKWHQNRRTDEKWLKTKSRTKGFTSIVTQKKNKPSGERELFIEIWNASDKRSWLTGKDLSSFEYYNFGELTKHPLWINLFHHVLQKKQYKKFILYKNNIILLSPQEHLDIHSMGIDQLKRKYGNDDIERYLEFIELLKEEYNNEH